MNKRSPDVTSGEHCIHWLPALCICRTPTDAACRGLNRASSADYSEQHNHDGDHQQDVDKATKGIGRYQPKQPQNEQNDGNGIEHDESPWVRLSQPLDWDDLNL